MTDEIEDLQARLAFQEDTLNSLNLQVVEQAREISDLQKQLSVLYKKVDDLSYQVERTQGVTAENERPPHY